MSVVAETMAVFPSWQPVLVDSLAQKEGGRGAGWLTPLASFHGVLSQGRLFSARDQVKVCCQVIRLLPYLRKCFKGTLGFCCWGTDNTPPPPPQTRERVQLCVAEGRGEGRKGKAGHLQALARENKLCVCACAHTLGHST